MLWFVMVTPFFFFFFSESPQTWFVTFVLQLSLISQNMRQSCSRFLSAHSPAKQPDKQSGANKELVPGVLQCISIDNNCDSNLSCFPYSEGIYGSLMNRCVYVYLFQRVERPAMNQLLRFLFLNSWLFYWLHFSLPQRNIKCWIC